MTLRNLGMIARSQMDYARAVELFRAALAATSAMPASDAYDEARGLAHLARAEFLAGDWQSAMADFEAALDLMRTAELAGHSLADCLDWPAAVATAQGRPLKAARLFGAAEAQWRVSGAVRYAPERAAYECDVDDARSGVLPTKHSPPPGTMAGR
jgi:tetratricopeptide (TPR) repeat protein